MTLQSFADKEAARLSNVSGFRSKKSGHAKMGLIKAIRGLRARIEAEFSYLEGWQVEQLIQDIKDMAALLVASEE